MADRVAGQGEAGQWLIRTVLAAYDTRWPAGAFVGMAISGVALALCVGLIIKR